MKKLVLLAMMLVGNFMLTNAQNDITLYIADRPENMIDENALCLQLNQKVFIYGQENCQEPVGSDTDGVS